MRRKEASEMLQVRSFMPLSYAQNKLWIPPPPQIVFACSSNCLRLRCFPRFGGRVGVSLARKHGFSMLVRIRELISQNWPFIFVAFEERVVTRPEQMRIKWLLLWPGLNILGTYQISSNYSEEWRVFFFRHCKKRATSSAKSGRRICGDKFWTEVWRFCAPGQCFLLG